MSLNKSRTKELAKPFFARKKLLDVRSKDENYAYKWLSVKKLEHSGFTTPDGWEIVSKLKSSDEATQKPTGLANQSNPLDNTERIGDLVLARMPKEKAEERNMYYRAINQLNAELIRHRQDMNQITDGRDMSFSVQANVRQGSKQLIKEE